MSEKTILNSIKNHVKKQNNNWQFIAGRTVLDKKAFIKKINGDKKFRKVIVQMVVKQTVEILGA